MKQLLSAAEPGSLMDVDNDPQKIMGCLDESSQDSIMGLLLNLPITSNDLPISLGPFENLSDISLSELIRDCTSLTNNKNDFELLSPTKEAPVDSGKNSSHDVVTLNPVFKSIKDAVSNLSYILNFIFF